MLSVLLGLAAACRPPEDPDGLDPQASTSAPVVDTAPTHLARFAEIESFTTVSRLRTAHPVGDHAATISVDPNAASYGQPGRHPMPVGAMVVEAMATDSDAPPHLYYVMHKQAAGYFKEGGDWEYSVVSRDGSLRATGKLALCARCHAEAPADFLFEHLP